MVWIFWWAAWPQGTQAWRKEESGCSTETFAEDSAQSVHGTLEVRRTSWWYCHLWIYTEYTEETPQDTVKWKKVQTEQFRFHHRASFMFSALPRHPDHWLEAPSSERRQRTQPPTVLATMALQSSKYIKEWGSPRKNAAVLVTVFVAFLITVTRHLTESTQERKGLLGFKEYSPPWWGKSQKQEGEEAGYFPSIIRKQGEMKGWCFNVLFLFSPALQPTEWFHPRLHWSVHPSDPDLETSSRTHS